MLHFNPNKTQNLKLSIHLITENESVKVLDFYNDSKLT